MRVIICGGRKYTMTPHDWWQLDVMHGGGTDVERRQLGPSIPPQRISYVYEGEANGADICARAWAESRAVPVLDFPARWYMPTGAYDSQAGKKRNTDMLEGRHELGPVPTPEGVIAARGGGGTADMAKKMHDAGRHVFRLRPPCQHWRREDVPFLRQGFSVFEQRWFDRGGGGPALVCGHLLKIGEEIVVPAEIPSFYCGRGVLPGHPLLPGTGLFGNPLRVREATAGGLVVVNLRNGGVNRMPSSHLLREYNKILRAEVQARPEVRDELAAISPASVLICWCHETTGCHSSVIANAAMQTRAAAAIRARGLLMPERDWRAYRIPKEGIHGSSRSTS